MKIDIKKISEGEESITVRYRELTPRLNKIIGLLRNDGKIWGKLDEESVSLDPYDILYIESVDDKVFAYTPDKVIKLDGTLNSFVSDIAVLIHHTVFYFGCSKAMIINVNKVVSLKSLSSNRIDATMEGGEHILISRRYASEFRRLLRGER